MHTPSILSALALAVFSGLPAQAQGICEEGCTPGYWKNHTYQWDGIGSNWPSTYVIDDVFNEEFNVLAAESGFSNTTTLLEVLETGGGGLDALGRHATAALLNADTGLCSGYTVAEVIELYRDAVGAAAGPATVSSAHLEFEASNEAGCPLNNGPDYPFCLGSTPGFCPCGLLSASGGCPNSTGDGASIERTAGTTSVFKDDMELTTTNMPPGAFGILLYSRFRDTWVFGGGVLCISPGNEKIFRGPVQQAGPGGAFVSGPGLVEYSCTTQLQPIGCIDPGETWYFQTWYRDGAAPCQDNFNMSNGLAVQFTL